MTPSPAGVSSKRRSSPANACSNDSRASRRAAGVSSTRSVAVTTWWCSGGTSTSTSLSVTTRMPSRRCCSGGRGPADDARRRVPQPFGELVDPGCAERRCCGAADQLLPRQAHSGLGLSFRRDADERAHHPIEIGDDLLVRVRLRRRAATACRESLSPAMRTAGATGRRPGSPCTGSRPSTRSASSSVGSEKHGLKW